MSIKDISIKNGIYKFTFADETIVLDEDHVLFPMTLTDDLRRSLVFVDTNDNSVYKTKDPSFFLEGNKKELTMDKNQFVLIGDVPSLLKSGCIFTKII